ncbi:hypothetical protein OH768_16430 [Streptomyces sp. NBC_01622]|uniref:hypothetical protein n=1 Tax=Streptomyces sp. NBC_01622 TaxID=2975903 RepID=UPI00386C4983|nr:hypothetical protein OH768_16430 [Streptomyces sp. NBC_01622]
MPEPYRAPAPPAAATGWFLGLCGELEATGDTARARLVLPEGHAPEADRLIAVEAMHQIACRLAARARGARRCVPARLDELEITDETLPADAVLEARLVRSGPLSTVSTSLRAHGRTCYAATVRTQEVM